MATTELDRAVLQQLAGCDLRYTRSRRAIVEGLRAADGPVTLPELLEANEELAQSSAYRNLSLMEEAGVVRRVAHGGGFARYELAESLTEHHHHLICDECGVVVDVVFDDEMERSLHRAIDRVSGATGFVAEHHAIDVYGRCADCATS